MDPVRNNGLLKVFMFIFIKKLNRIGVRNKITFTSYF